VLLPLYIPPSCLFYQAFAWERDLGIFTAIGFMISVGNMAVVSLGQSASPDLPDLLRQATSQSTVRSSPSSSPLGDTRRVRNGLFKLAGREILTILFRPEYAERAELLPWIMAVGGVLFMAQFFGIRDDCGGYYNSQVILNILANLSLFAGCYWLVSRQGLLGAIFGMLIAAIVQLTGAPWF